MIVMEEKTVNKRNEKDNSSVFVKKIFVIISLKLNYTCFIENTA